MRVASLFSGVGGFDLGFEREGFEICWQSENDPYASRVLARHWPLIENLGDIHDIIHPPFPYPDVLVGGFPCQDYSKAGRGAGLAGDRGALWWEYHRLIARCRPTWVVGENVDSLVYSRDGEDFETIISSLVELGYGVVWGILDAQYFGVAQQRRRVFIVGHIGGVPRPQVLALGEGLCGHPQPSRQEGEKATGALTGRFGEGGSDVTDAIAGHLVAGPLTSKQGPSRLDDHAIMSNHIVVNGAQSPAITNNVAQSLDQNSRASQVVAYVENQRNEVRSTGELSPALNASARNKQAPMVMAEMTVRRLTPLECERLQGFPDGWTEGVSDTQRYQQMGNAVAVPVAQWIAQQIREATDRDERNAHG